MKGWMRASYHLGSAVCLSSFSAVSVIGALVGAGGSRAAYCQVCQDPSMHKLFPFSISLPPWLRPCCSSSINSKPGQTKHQNRPKVAPMMDHNFTHCPRDLMRLLYSISVIPKSHSRLEVNVYRKINVI